MAVRKNQPGDTDPEPEGTRPPNGASSQQARITGDAHAGPHAIAISGNVHYTEGPSEELILTLLHALDSLKPEGQRLDDRRGPGERDVSDVSDVQAEPARRPERESPADAPSKPADQSRKTVPSPPTGVPMGEHDEAPPPHPVAPDGNARERRRLRGLLSASRVTRPAAILLAVLLAVAIVVAIAFVVGTRFSSGTDDRGAAAQPTEHAGGPSASQSHSASAAPTQTPSRTPPRAPDDPGGTTATPAPRPSPSPTASSGNPAPGPPPPPPRPQRPPGETASKPTTPDHVPGKIFIVRGHGNEMNVNLTGFAPDEDVTIYAYTDTDATDGPYDQRTHTIDADGTREFGAFPMEASGDYWVVALGVTSNVIPWTGR
ncbi:hypothetical protein [Streptomyces sp. NPDC102264]|uniref:hypothetical protein n=1 Tax=Streptomyces sp. NPDC102264 TaxID=3366149 RepID=UPI00381CD6A1